MAEWCGGGCANRLLKPTGPWHKGLYNSNRLIDSKRCSVARNSAGLLLDFQVRDPRVGFCVEAKPGFFPKLKDRRAERRDQ